MALTVVNDWESLFYYDDGKKVGNPIQTIKKVSVKWSDGTMQEYNVKWRTDEVQYSDMGHCYSVTQHRMYILMDIHGTQTEFPIYEKIYKHMNNKPVVEIVR